MWFTSVYQEFQMMLVVSWATWRRGSCSPWGSCSVWTALKTCSTPKSRVPPTTSHVVAPPLPRLGRLSLAQGSSAVPTNGEYESLQLDLARMARDSSDHSVDAQSYTRLYFVCTTFANATLANASRSHQQDFPPKFRIFIASATNLAWLPDDLYQSWPPYMLIAFETSQFTTVPQTVIKLRPTGLSLSQNRISSVPAELFEIPSLQALRLPNTWVQEIHPTVQRAGARMRMLALGGTNVSTLWAWMDPLIARSYQTQLVNLDGSRFCVERESIEAGVRILFSAVDSVLVSALAKVMDMSTPERLA